MQLLKLKRGDGNARLDMYLRTLRESAVRVLDCIGL